MQTDLRLDESICEILADEPNSSSILIHVQSLVTSHVSLASITESNSSTFFPPAEVVLLGSVSFLSGPPVYHGEQCRCLNLSTSIGGTRSKVEGGDRYDLEPESMREDTKHKIYTGSGSRSSYHTSCLE
jgi:hypothetical protein